LGVFKGARVGGFARFPAVVSLPRIDPKAIYPASEAASAYASAPHMRALSYLYSEWIDVSGGFLVCCYSNERMHVDIAEG
jgi:hypothetical protein